MAASQEGHWFEKFSANVQHILGEHPAHSVLADLARPEQGAGESTWINGIDAYSSDDATNKAFTADETLKKFHQLAGGSQDFAEWLLTRTPFNDVLKIKSLSASELNEWGHAFSDSEDTWQNLADPKSTVVSVGMQKMHRQRDIQFAKGATAATVSRRIDGAAVASVALPASQTLGDLFYSTATVDTLPALITEKFDNVWFTKGMPIYCAISATLARNLRVNSRDKLHSTDFVRSYDNFRQGTIPEVEGVTFIVMPKEFMESVKAVEGTAAGNQTDHYFAWSPNAISRVNYQGLQVKSGIDVGAKFNTQVYATEYCDFVRTDDKGVVVGDIVVPPA